MKALNDYILIEIKEAETKLPSGIVIPDSAKEKPQKGVVISSGNSTIVKKGDTVLFKKWEGTETKFEGKECLFVKEENILALEE